MASVARFSEANHRTFLTNVGHFLGHFNVKSDKQSEYHTDPLIFQFYCIFMPQFFKISKFLDIFSFPALYLLIKSLILHEMVSI